MITKNNDYRILAGLFVALGLLGVNRIFIQAFAGNVIGTMFVVMLVSICVASDCFFLAPDEDATEIREEEDDDAAIH